MKIFSRVVFVTLLFNLSAFVSTGDWTRFQGPMPADVDINRLPMNWSPNENVQ